MLNDATLLDEPHHQALELLAARALNDGDGLRAFALADRRCRIAPAPQAHSYLLRAEAAFRLGHIDCAVADCRTALDIAPDSVAACRRMLAWSIGPDQHRAARTLLTEDDDVEVLRKALAVLWAGGETAFATMAVLDDAVRGWAAWRSDAALEIAVHDDAGDRSVLTLAPDLFHRLSDAQTRAVAFSLPRTPSPHPQTIVLSIGGQAIRSVRAAGTAPRRPTAEAVRPGPKAVRPAPHAAAETRPTVVIVPVYQDFEATRLCLDHLLPQLGGAVRAILVNDASPDPRITGHLGTLAGAGSVDLIENPLNLGFVGAVNRALARVRGEDVVLLNADTVVPPGFLGRLAAAAHGAPDIGTAMPLSNNGEFSSFPIPNEVNPLPPIDEIMRLDAIAARVNAGTVVDVPSGIGFCLYVTAECAAAVGPLHDRFHRGYLEDVDFCLRARALGFRNVCAPSVYVGHAGSRSFRDEKRSLVLRNLDILDTRFPFYRAECRAVIDADPLRAARARIEHAALAVARPVLLVAGDGAVGEVARARGRRLAEGGTAALLLTVGAAGCGTIATLSEPTGGLPQSLQFALAEPPGLAALDSLLRRLSPARIELVDPRATTWGLLDLLLGLASPLDLVVADSGLACPPGVPFRSDHARADATTAGRAGAVDVRRWARTWREVVGRADRIVAPCAQAQWFARRVTGRTAAIDPDESSAPREDIDPGIDRMRARTPRLGVVVARRSAAEFRLVRTIAAALRRARPQPDLVVLGGTIDDPALLRLGNVFVSGPIAPAELDTLVSTYRLSHLLAGSGEPLFGHPLVAAALSTPTPTAFVDWSGGTLPPRDGDLPIDPGLPDGHVAGLLSDWITAGAA